MISIMGKQFCSSVDTAVCNRFYFVSDDELLSVLGSSDPTSIQEHSLKLFDNCGSLKFARGNKVITGMISSEVRKLNPLS